MIQAMINREKLNIAFSILMFIALMALISAFNYNKKKYVDLYAVCSSMALNNRLQSLREIILIKHREMMGNNNRYKIENAKFHYILSQSKEDKNAYDIHYSMSFKLIKPLFMRRSINNRTFRFFIITLEASPKNFKSKIITNKNISAQNSIKTIKCAKNNYTIRGESGSREKSYSGLYDIITVIPPDIAKKKCIEINISYDILGQIKKTQDKHSFTIIPHNYSSKIKRLEVRVQNNAIEIDNLELQRYGINEEFEIAELFIPCEPTSPLCGNSREASIESTTEDIYEHYTLIKPNMASAYSVQFDLPK